MIAIVALGGLFIAVWRTRPVQIAWHTWRMESAYSDHTSQTPESIGGLSAIDVGEEFERFEHHRMQLVRLGVVAERRYTIRHVTSPTAESKHLLRRLFDEPPPSIFWEANYPDPPGPQGLTLWCWAKDATAWDEYIAARNVPDYRERFMGNEKE